MITKWFVHRYQSSAVAGQVCVSFFMFCAVNNQSLGSVFHINSSCSYIKRYYYILVHSVVKFGCVSFLTSCHSVNDTCVFPFLVILHLYIHRLINTQILPTIKMRLLINPVHFLRWCKLVLNRQFAIVKSETRNTLG